MSNENKSSKRCGNVLLGITVIIYCLLVLLSVYFLFEMKNWGFSMYELATIGAFLLIVLLFIGANVCSKAQLKSTMILTLIIIILFGLIQVAALTVLKTWLMNFFVL